MVNMERIDVALKGTKDDVVKMIAMSMEQYPEIRDAILLSAKTFIDNNKFNPHL